MFGRLAGYEDLNDAERLSLDPAMRAIVDRRGLDRYAASASEMGRFETEWLTIEGNLAALVDLPGAWSTECTLAGCRQPGRVGLQRPFRLHVPSPTDGGVDR